MRERRGAQTGDVQARFSVLVANESAEAGQCDLNVAN